MSHYRPDQARAPQAAAVLRFWFGEAGEYGQRLKRWFEKDPAFDVRVRAEFSTLYEATAAGDNAAWLERPADCLAYVIVLDQFPRHIYRGEARAFAADALALRAARHAVARRFDREMLPVERLFLYLPLQHSESLEDQQQGCELTQPLTAFAETSDVYRYALAHRDVVQRFGRFPHRNAALGRESTAEEIAFLKQPGSSF